MYPVKSSGGLNGTPSRVNASWAYKTAYYANETLYRSKSGFSASLILSGLKLDDVVTAM